MNTNHVEQASALVLQLIADMKEQAHARDLQTDFRSEHFLIRYPGFHGTQDYSYFTLIKMALIATVTRCPFKINIISQYNDMMQPEVDMSHYIGEFPSGTEIFSKANIALAEFVAKQKHMPAHIFWRMAGEPTLNATAQEREIYAVLENIYADGRFRNQSLTQNHFLYAYLTDTLEYTVTKMPDRGDCIALSETADTAYFAVCKAVLKEVKKELGSVIVS